jgi:hypothetical protein
MTYKIARMLDGRFAWFEPGEAVPSSCSDIRPAPVHVAALAERMLAEDATGEISDATATQMRDVLDALSVNA